MRPAFVLSVLFTCTSMLAGLGGCTDGYLQADEIDDSPELAQEDDLLELVPAPEQRWPERPSEPEPEPEHSWDDRFSDGSAERPRLGLNDGFGYVGPCEFSVIHEGLPAIDRERELIVDVEFGRPAGPTDYDESLVQLVWRDFDDNILRTEEIYDGRELAPGSYDDAPRVYCARARRPLEQRIPQLNAYLDAEALTPLPLLLVQNPPIPGLDEPESESESKNGDARAVEFIFNGGQLIARIPGVKVLWRTPRPDWQGPVDSLDAYNPNILAVYADRETEIAVIKRSYESASCMSDTQVYSGVQRLPGWF